MDPPLSTRDVTVKLKEGLHMRPAALILKLAQSYPCEVNLRFGDRLVNAKSNIELLTLFAEQGSVLRIEACGDRAEEAVLELAQLFDANFHLDGEATG